MEKLVCILCPKGCVLDLEIDGSHLVSVSGNQCKKGIEYAREEVEDPKRNISSTVRVKGSNLFETLPVKTESPIPKDKIFPVMEEIRKIELKPPIKFNEIVIGNVCNTGVNIISAREIQE